jgi:cytochrome c-type biogenesis protein CcmF
VIAELGHFLLWLALAVSVALGVVPLVGTFRGRADWMALSRPLAGWLFFFTAASFALLTVNFVQHDFSVAYVANNSNSELPLHYRITAVWGGHEGSMLLWLVMMAGWTVAVAAFSRSLPLPDVARVLSVMGLSNIGFTLFTLATSNPFDRLVPPAAEGRDLNPLLQDPGMIFHPPMLYMGYVGFSVAFAFAVAALISGRLDATWARWTRPWTTVAWIFLTLGIALGSWWAYYELGWGGWWFWDPVENASFMPWLVGTALIHSLAVTEKRGAFKNWTVLLAILAFSLSLLGTFLVRSGVLSSVHAFATDPRRGLFILAFLVIVIGVTLALYAWRAPTVGLGTRFGLVSRETFLLANNVLLIVAMFAVMLGTLYPLVIDALGLGKLSVGPPYFNTVFVPLMAPLVFLMGVGPLARWKEATLPDLATRLKWAAAVAVIAALASGWLAGHIGLVSTLALAMAWWIIASTATDIALHVRVPGAGLGAAWNRLRQQPRAVAGMWLAHTGVAVFIIGVTMVSAFQVERDVTLEPGKSVEVDGMAFTFKGVVERPGPNYDAIRGTVEVARDGRTIATMQPEKRVYRVNKNPMTEAAIRTRLSGDVYISLGEPVTQDIAGAWVIRIYLKPFVGWIWGGCVIMALGGLLAASDRRYRARAVRTEGAALAAKA